MYLRVRRAAYKKTTRGDELVISMIGLYEDNGKLKCYIKLKGDTLLEFIKNQKINLPIDD